VTDHGVSGHTDTGYPASGYRGSEYAASEYRAPEYQGPEYSAPEFPAYPAAGYPASDYAASGYPVSGYTGPGHTGPGNVVASPAIPPQPASPATRNGARSGAHARGEQSFRELRQQAARDQLEHEVREQSTSGVRERQVYAGWVEPDTRQPDARQPAGQAAPGSETMVIAAVLEHAGAGATGARLSRGLAVRLLPLLGVLVVQAFLALPLLRADSAAEDEALYLWAGHLEWAHWLHGTRIPAFPTYFSGAPVLYPPIGALADSLGGLTGARMLSLAFMLGATALLWATTSRLYGDRSAFFATALFVALAPTLHLSAYATYDPMSLFLVALAAWCVVAAPGKGDGVRWIVCAGLALVLANTAKYASALFDPVVVAMAVLAVARNAGWRAALRRGALLTGLVIMLLLLLVRLGGPLYQVGISSTTTLRSGGTTAPATVLLDAWHWTAPVVVLAAGALLIKLLSRAHPIDTVLTAVLGGAALLAPADQARIHTVTSLLKHVDFGAWFAAIAAGYLMASVAGWLRPRLARELVTVAAAACIAPLLVVGVTQSRGQQFLFWPNSTRLITVLRPLTSHGGRYLAETGSVPEYYLPDTSWRQWSNTFSITLPSGASRNESGPQPYINAIKDHYFSVVVLDFTETLNKDGPIASFLDTDSSYKAIAVPRYPGQAQYYVWVYVPPRSG
jgi:hypothetical protein